MAAEPPTAPELGSGLPVAPDGQAKTKAIEAALWRGSVRKAIMPQTNLRITVWHWRKGSVAGLVLSRKLLPRFPSPPAARLLRSP
jgi:hypothetical protein